MSSDAASIRRWEADATPGLPVTLTIDERLQFIAERELAAAAVKPITRRPAA